MYNSQDTNSKCTTLYEKKSNMNTPVSYVDYTQCLIEINNGKGPSCSDSNFIDITGDMSGYTGMSGSENSNYIDRHSYYLKNVNKLLALDQNSKKMLNELRDNDDYYHFLLELGKTTRNLIKESKYISFDIYNTLHPDNMIDKKTIKRLKNVLKNFEEKPERKHLGRKQVGNIIFVIFVILLFLMFLW